MLSLKRLLQQPEVTKNEDGSADITFEPGAVNQEGGQDHYANLADLLPDQCFRSLRIRTLEQLR